MFLPDAKNGIVNAKVRLRNFLPQQIMYGDPKFDSAVVRVEIFEKSSNIKVGDSLQKLLEVYPTLENWKFPDGFKRYRFPESELWILLYFDVIDDVIIKILYLGYL